MANIRLSNKHVAVDKAKTIIVALIGVAAVITVFSLVVSRSLLSQARYINKVNGRKDAALKQLKANEEAVTSLVDSYKAFANQDVNVLSGSRTGAGERDGDNAKLVLDALPSKYDFPGLISSVEKMLSGTNIKQITGTDNSLSSQQIASNPSAIEVPISFTVDVNYDTARQVISRFEHSIRPFAITKLDINSGSNGLQMVVDSNTYYQPEKDIQIRKEDVK